jgi:predicted TIM-barrel fold metal-dependent hydrolase
MIIDVHGHMSAPAELWAYKAVLLAARGAHGRGAVHVTDDQIRASLQAKETFGAGHLDLLDKHRTDFQLISPRPFQMMHSEKPGRIIQWFHEETHNIIHREVQMFPDRFAGVCMLAQVAGQPIAVALPELERCVKQLGFVGCLVNSDPFENSGIEAPGLGDRYWYPLYEKLCELDVPAMLHGTGSRSERVSYSTHFINEETSSTIHLVNSAVFDDFPKLKFIIPHGGGAVPYQLGRFESPSLRAAQRGGKRFSEKLRNVWFDTTLYTPLALELLIKTVGADRCLFATECPGTGSAPNPETGRYMDDVASYIKAFDWLSETDRRLIFEDNARSLFKLTAKPRF